MPFQSQELTTFDGLVTTGEGTNIPRSSFADEVNIDHQRRTIRGREPSQRVADHELPQIGYYLDGISTSCGFTIPAGVATVLGSAEWCVRLNIGDIDVERLGAFDTGTRFALITGSGNSSTDITTPLSGFNVYLEVQSDNTVDTFFQYRTASGVITLTDNLDWDDGEHLVLEVGKEDGTGYFLRLHQPDGSATGVSNADADVMLTTLVTAMFIGAYVDSGTVTHSLHAIGITGGVTILNDYPADGVNVFGRFQGFDLGDLPTEVTFFWSPSSSAGYSDVAYGDTVACRPRCPHRVTTRIDVEKGSWGQLDLTMKLSGSKAWMAILEFEIPAQPLNATAPPWLLAASNLEMYWSLGFVSTTQYTLTVSIGLVDADGDPIGILSHTTANLTFATNYRVAVVGYSDQGTRSTTMDVYLYTGSWASSGTDNSTGLPRNPESWYFCSNKTQARVCEAELNSFRLFNNFDTIPADATAVTNIDVYPTDGGGVTQWPARIVASFDARAASVREVDSGSTAIVLDRVVSWRDDYNGRYSIEFMPENGINRWSAFRNISRSHRPKIHAARSLVESIGGNTTRFINYLIAGGVYRYNETDDTGEWLQHRNFAGSPTNGVVSIESKDRQIMAGSGFTPIKVFPGGVSGVGLPPPEVGLSLVSSAAGTGGLDSTDTEYYFKVTIYNSQTGQESNATPDRILLTKSLAAHDTINARIFYMNVQGGTNDWDTIRVYRQIAGAGLDEFYLDQEVPRPTVLPPTGADIDFQIGQADADLFLQPVLQYDNDIPPAFSCAAVANRTLYVGYKGRVRYSKVLFLESFPALNIFQLDDDETNSVRAIVAIFGRLVIIKSKGIWGGPENAGEVGQEPVLLHKDRGLVSGRAWATADNVIYFMSPDRVVYGTDGVQLEDVSSAFIKRTLQGYEEAQLSGVQAVHDARSKSIWFLIPKSSSQKGANREVLVFRYDSQRWQKYEMPVDSLNAGHDSGDFGEFGGFAYRGSFYRLVDGDTNLESDAGSGETVFTYDYDDDDANESLLVSSGQVKGASSITKAWDESIEGMPCIIVPHDTVYDSADPETYHPLWNEGEDVRIYNYVRGVRSSGGTEYIYFGENFTSTARYLWVGVGFQYRRVLSQWITPQGEERPHMFFGGSFVHHPDHTVNSTEPRFRYAVDYTSFLGLWRTISAEPRFPNTNHEFRRRSRAFRFEIAEGDGRGKQFEITRVMWRYRVRGPRRKR